MIDVAGELRRHERLRAVTHRHVWLGVDLDDDPVGADGSGRERQRRDQVTAACGVTWIDDHGQVAELLQDRHGRQIERESVGGLERADAALAQHHGLIAFLEDVLSGHQQLLERRREAPLEQHRAPRAPDLRQQRVVLHVARADLDHVGHLEHLVEVPLVHQLGDDRQAGLGLGLGE